jgi:hypothetical protein
MRLARSATKGPGSERAPRLRRACDRKRSRVRDRRFVAVAIEMSNVHEAAVVADDERAVVGIPASLRIAKCQRPFGVGIKLMVETSIIAKHNK